jgi:hypothetical protein
VVKANWRDNPWFTAELEQERLDCLRMQPDQYDHIWEGGYITFAEARTSRSSWRRPRTRAALASSPLTR